MSWSSVPSAQRAKVRAYVLARCEYRCELKMPGCTTVATQADHKVAREIGGDGADTLQGACANCNGSAGKGDPRRYDPPAKGCSWL